ncbi:Ig-like domain-containing protein [Cellulomonas sp. URHB0016]
MALARGTSDPSTGRPLRTRSRRRTAALATVLALVVAPFVAFAATAPAQAAASPFTKRFSVNTNGDVLMAANTLITCSNVTTCPGARQGISGNLDNNEHTDLTFVDVVSDGATTYNSSSAAVKVPDGGSVLFAALVWGGRNPASVGNGPASADPRRTVQLAVDSTTAWQPVKADELNDNRSAAESIGVAYEGYADVTALVAHTGTHTYTVGNVPTSTAANQYGGWALVVAVSDPMAPMRNLTVFSGFDDVNTTSHTSSTIDVSGFLTPPAGDVHTTLGAVTFEGDLGRTGDGMSLTSIGSTRPATQVADSLNPKTNPFNSSITSRGSAGTTRNPSYANQFGFDADQFTVDGALDNGATSARIALTTTSDQYFPVLVSFATELYDPKLLGTKTVEDLDPAAVPAGGGADLDVDQKHRLRYTVPVQNIGLDAAANSVFFDAIPTGTTYVPDSLHVTDSVDGRDVAVSDDAGDDLGEFVPADGNGQGYVTINLGDGATPTRGGTIPVWTSATQRTVTVTFDVEVDDTVTTHQELVNAAHLSYTGFSTMAANASATNAVRSVVRKATVVAGAQPPVAAPHLVTFSPSDTARDLTIDVLADATYSGPSVDLIDVTEAAGGTLTTHADGTVTYAPRPDFAGRDVFTYTIEDAAGNRSTALVQVDVVNAAPVAVDDVATTPGDTTTLVDVLANDSDANGDTRTIRSVGPTAQGGTVVIDQGKVSYTPPLHFHGTDSFTYVLQDSRGASDDATVTVTVVNGVPVAVPEALHTTTGTALTFPSVLANDTDPEHDPLTAHVVSGPSHGTLSLDSTGTGTYTPAPGWFGTDSFTYSAHDGTDASPAVTVTITVHAPVAPADDTSATASGTAVVVDVLGNDPGSASLTVTGATPGTHGTTSVGPDGKVTYTPDPGYAGQDTFTYTVTDGYASDEATVTVTVANAVPVAVPGVVTTPTGTPVTIDVLANVTDVNVGSLTDQVLTLVGTPTADHGATVAVGPDGRVTVTPADGFAGDVVVSYTVTDGAGGTVTGTVVVTVTNAAPLAPPVLTTTPYGRPITVDLLGNASDANGADTLSVVPGSVTDPVDANGTTRGHVSVVDGVATYTPPAGFSGDVTFGYDVTDGLETTHVTVVVTVQNGTVAPRSDDRQVAATGPTVLDVLAGQQDPDGGTLTLLGVTQPAHGTVEIVDGKLVFTPEPGWSGPVTFTYTVVDGQGGLTTSTMTLDVAAAAPVPTAPVPTPPVPTAPVPAAPVPTAPVPAAPGPGATAVPASTPAAGEQLATTGASGTGPAMGLGLLLVSVGLVLVALRRRRTAV